MEDYLKVLDEVALQNAALARRQYDPEIPEKIEYEDKPCKWWFNHWAEQNPKKPYAVLGDLVLPYAYCNDVARRLANAFLDLGVKKGDRVAIMAGCIKGAKYRFALQDGTWDFSLEAVVGKG